MAQSVRQIHLKLEAIGEHTPLVKCATLAQYLSRCQ